jgi:hypothetical protein
MKRVSPADAAVSGSLYSSVLNLSGEDLPILSFSSGRKEGIGLPINGGPSETVF